MSDTIDLINYNLNFINKFLVLVNPCKICCVLQAKEFAATIVLALSLHTDLTIVKNL